MHRSSNSTLEYEREVIRRISEDIEHIKEEVNNCIWRTYINGYKQKNYNVADIAVKAKDVVYYYIDSNVVSTLLDVIPHNYINRRLAHDIAINNIRQSSYYKSHISEMVNTVNSMEEEMKELENTNSIYNMLFSIDT